MAVSSFYIIVIISSGVSLGPFIAFQFDRHTWPL